MDRNPYPPDIYVDPIHFGRLPPDAQSVMPVVDVAQDQRDAAMDDVVAVDVPVDAATDVTDVFDAGAQPVDALLNDVSDVSVDVLSLDEAVLDAE